MENNKLIGDFMDIHNTELSVYKESAYKYHTSWDWLMPVVIKCKESVDYCNDDNALKYHNIEDEMLSQLSIEDTYNAVVEFIKTYNNEQQ